MLAKGAATMMWRGRHACSCGEHAVLCVWCVEDRVRPSCAVASALRAIVSYVFVSTCLLRKRCETCSLLTGKSFYYGFASAAGRSGVYICTACLVLIPRPPRYTRVLRRLRSEGVAGACRAQSPRPW